MKEYMVEQYKFKLRFKNKIKNNILSIRYYNVRSYSVIFNSYYYKPH